MTRDRGRDLKQLDRVLESTHGPASPSLHPLVRERAERVTIAEQLVSLLDPESFAADQYRALRHNVELQRKESNLRMFAVTSPGPGDGKTVTTLNLAGTLAQGVDARVLVIDADMRRPKVADYLGLANQDSPGLAELIEDPAYDLGLVVRRINGFNLSVLLAGTPEASPYELLNSPRLEALLADARRRYDWVIVDTPPIVAVPDGRLIGRWVDAFLLIVAAHRTPRRLVAEALDLIDPAKVIGVVFNGDNRPLSHRYYGYYGRYYTNKQPHASWWRRALNPNARKPKR